MTHTKCGHICVLLFWLIIWNVTLIKDESNVLVLLWSLIATRGQYLGTGWGAARTVGLKKNHLRFHCIERQASVQSLSCFVSPFILLSSFYRILELLHCHPCLGGVTESWGLVRDQHHLHAGADPVIPEIWDRCRAAGVIHESSCVNINHPQSFK